MCKRGIVLLMAFVIAFTTGCSNTKLNASSDNEGATFVSMEEEPNLDYTVPKSLPHILTDQLGYIPSSSKVALFYGKKLPDEFTIVSEETGEIVYSGTTQLKGHDNFYDADVSYGEFTDLVLPGKYHINADYLGRSFSFEIKDDIYNEEFIEACKKYYYNRCGITLTESLAGNNAHNACHTGNAVLREDMTVSKDVSGGWHQDATGSKDILSATKTLGYILLSYEIFPNAFADNSGIPESGNGIPDILDEAKYETDWLLKMQNEETGAVYSALTVSDGADNKNQVMYVEPADLDSSRAFAYALSKFSYLYQNYDIEYATTCLKAADRAWKYSILNETATDKSNAYKFIAAAEIYRASGSKECENYLNEYFSSRSYGKIDDELVLLGVITYLNTKMDVNKEFCTDTIKIVMSRAEDISSKSREAIFQVGANAMQDNNNELLNDMITMTLVDHVIANHEYDTIIENYLHYFLGQNPMSITYLDNVGTNNYIDVHETLGLMKQFDQNSKLIFMLSKIISKDGFVEE